METIRVKAPSVGIKKDLEFGRVILVFESEKADIEFHIPAYNALDVGLELLANAKAVIDEFYDRAQKETIQ